jgi:hypothetical protein
MRITATGNVGIGTASPSTTLSIYQTFYDSGTSVATIYDALSFDSLQNLNSKVVLCYGSTQSSGGGNSGGGVFAIKTRPQSAGGATAPVERLRITDLGFVGIGTAGPSYQLDLSTDGARKLTTTTWLTGSDQRIKTDIQSANLQMCYDTVKSIDLKYFKWNFPPESNVTVDDKHSLGFIAQAVKSIFPNAVSESNSYGYTDFLSLNTDQILKAMYGALKQTMEDKERLEQSLATATAKVSSLEQSLSSLTHRLTALEARA